MPTRTTTSLAFFCCWFAGLAIAQAPIDLEKDFAPGSYKRFAARVNAAQTSNYSEVLAAYDARLAAHPDDVVSHIERCRFIETFAYAEDVVIESSSEDLKACREQLEQGAHARDIDVILYGIERSWDEKKTQEAQDLIPQSEGWTRDQQATLFELLTDKFRWKEPQLASGYALRAVSLRPGSRVLMTAAERLVELGAKDKARRLIVEAPASTWESLPRYGAAKLLVDLGDPKAAAMLLKSAKSDAQDESSFMLARILANTGEVDAARQMYHAAMDGQSFVAYENRLEFFRFELAHGNAGQAIAAYDQIRKQGFGADILARLRMSLFVAHPDAPWQGRDWLGLLMLAAVLLVFAAFPLVVIAPIHYRGLARRVAGRLPDKTATTWRLRHAWYAMAVISVTGAIALYVFTPEILESIVPRSIGAGAGASDIELGKQLPFSVLCALLLLAPLLRGRSLKSLLLGNWSIVRSVLAGVGFAIALKVAAVILSFATRAFGALGSDTTRAIQGTHELFGVTGMLLTVAVAVPISEELVFRGVMLEAFRGQVTFLLANVVQAAAFAASHESPGDMPFLFVFGLLAGWLAKRSGGLLTSMTMHATFNLTSAMTIIGITSILNR